jgi:hypothetical protein
VKRSAGDYTDDARRIAELLWDGASLSKADADTAALLLSQAAELGVKYPRHWDALDRALPGPRDSRPAKTATKEIALALAFHVANAYAPVRYGEKEAREHDLAAAASVDRSKVRRALANHGERARQVVATHARREAASKGREQWLGLPARAAARQLGKAGADVARWLEGLRKK